MIILQIPPGNVAYPGAYNADQLISIGYNETGPTTFVYTLNFAPVSGVTPQQYVSSTVYTSAASAISAAVALLQSLPLISILSTLNLVEAITLT